jgi:F0F1-type ATP synthase membrane subunit b/b'
VAKASDQAQSDRLARLAAARLEADQLVAEGVEAARREAADIGVRAEQRLPQLLDRVLKDVRADVFDPRTGPGRS